MKRGIILNLVLLFTLVLLAALPFLIMLVAGLVSEALGCQMNGASMPEGFCGTLYAIITVIGWTSIGIVPLTVGALLIYLAGVFIFFFISWVVSGLRGQPVLPVAKGMLTSTLVVFWAGGLIVAGILGVNWFRVDFVNRCEGLPDPKSVTGAPNGPMALAVKVPADSDLESRTILVLAPEGNLLFRLSKAYWGRSPAWSPDGRQFAFVSQDFQTRRFALHLADLQGQVSPALLDEQTKLEELSWLPDGKALLFTGQATVNDAELYFVNVNGSGLRRLTGSERFDGEARISPDGKQIVFVSDRDGNEDIYLMNIDGSNVRRLTNHPANDTQPAWSPDGRWIVFASTRGSGIAMNNYDLYIMAVDGSSQCQLTKNETPAWRPVWSPDGQWIAYIGLYERKLYLVRPDGTDNYHYQFPVDVEDIYSLDWAAE